MPIDPYRVIAGAALREWRRSDPAHGHVACADLEVAFAVVLREAALKAARAERERAVAIRDILYRAIHGGCVWKLGHFLVEAENALEKYDSPAIFPSRPEE